MKLARRDALRAGAAGLLAAGCGGRDGQPAPDAESGPDAEARAVDTLVATAEALVPVGEAAWARAFLGRRLRDKPEEAPAWRALAARVGAEGRKRGAAFAALPAAEREAAIKALHPSLADEPALAPPAKQERALLRALASAFFVSDHLSLEDAAVFAGPPRDVAQPSTPAFSQAGGFPDAHFGRLYGMALAVGDYQRVWAAAGYEAPPGVCKSADDYVKAPGGG